jgi:hypothetical protein
MSVDVATAPRLTLGTPTPVFRLPQPRSALVLTSRDGRFLLLTTRVEAGERPLVVSTAIDQSRRD